MKNRLHGLSDHIEPSEMPTDRLAEIAEIIGVDAAIRLCEEFAGIQITLSRKELTLLKREYVRRVGNGDARNLARHLDVCERQVYRWLNESIQTNLFENDTTIKRLNEP